jgi:protein TonB
MPLPVERSAEILEFPRSPDEPAAREEETRLNRTPIAWFLAGSALLHAVALLSPVPLIHDEVRLPAVLTPLTVTVAPAPEAEGADAPRPAPEIEPKAPPVPSRTPVRLRAEAAPTPLLSPSATAPSAPARNAPPEALRADPPPLFQAYPPMPPSAGGPAPGAVPAVEPQLSRPVPLETTPGGAPEKTPGSARRAALETTPPSYTADYLRNPPPEYPLSARRLGQEGWVVLRVKVDPSGAPAEVHLAQSSGVISLDQAALEAVRHWTFVPARRGGEVVTAWVEVPIRFQLRDDGK